MFLAGGLDRRRREAFIYCKGLAVPHLQEKPTGETYRRSLQDHQI
jgi:hypothetical protein